MDQFRTLLQRLAAGGWAPLLDLLAIDPESPSLREDLLRPVPPAPDELALVPGFGDLAPSARRAIEPGSPARSVLFHALASPGVVTNPDGTDLAAFPTPAELDLAENTVFGIVSPSLAALAARSGGANLAVTVFAREYRQAAKTVHGMHADMIFSRTGVARVGTKEALWNGRRRAYVPRDDADDPFAFRALPCRYGVYLSVQARGAERVAPARAAANGNGHAEQAAPETGPSGADDGNDTGDDGQIAGTVDTSIPEDTAGAADGMTPAHINGRNAAPDPLEIPEFLRRAH